MPHYSESNVEVLQAERTNDPLVRGYSGMTDQQFADSMNTADRDRNRTSMSGSEVLQAVDAAEYAALTVTDQQVFWGLLGIGELDPFGVEAQVVQDIFGASTTVTNLAAARVEQISRAEELGLPPVLIGDAARTN